MTRARFATITPFATILALGASLVTNVSAQGSWEYLGPGVGYYTEALGVTDQALYVGMAAQDETGLGLYRYRFADGQWDLFALAGQRVTAVSVAGANDERIVVVRFDPAGFSELLRSTDGGQTWTTTYGPVWADLRRIRRAPSESTHLFVVVGLRSTDDGASWQWSEFPHEVVDNRFEAAFDPQNADVLYMTGQNWIEAPIIYKSTDGGGTFYSVDAGSLCWGIDVDTDQPTRILAAFGLHTRTSTDAGVSWTTRSSSPLAGKMVAVAPWASGAFFVLGSSGGYYDVARTSDMGATWEFLAPGLPSIPSGYLSGIRMYLESHPTQPDLYVALEGSGVWRFAFDPAAAPDFADRPPTLQLAACPNPATDGFRIHVRLPQAAQASLRLFDLQGRVVDTLFDGAMPEGARVVGWARPAGGRVPAGVYYLRLDAGAAHVERAVTLIR